MSEGLDKLLAKSVMPIVDAIGYDLTVRLVARLGGTRVYLASSVHPRDELAQVIGLQAACHLVKQLGRGAFDVPRCQAWLMARRNEEIVNRWDAGETQRELALRFGLTERHVRSVIAAAGRPHVQPGCAGTADLFHSTPETEGAPK